ncbi:MAG: cytochrome c [Gammaproteobacteria bacterium]|nr:cytochrome c [Gammaproteobacteria bacterium]
MRWSHFIILQCLLILTVAGIAYTHKDRVHVTKSPPESLSQWYKPENKRQVWLHNMFKLRREMQAMEFYANNNNAALLKKWADSFNGHYLEVAEMVPQWSSKLDFEALHDLQAMVGSENFTQVVQVLEKIAASCTNCHNDYRAIVATMYRAADFSAIEVAASLAFREHMIDLSKQLNQIKIASVDGMQELSLASLSNLKKGIDELGRSCSACHIEDVKPYPDDKLVQTIALLEESLESGGTKDQGRALGTLAVQACAHCHGTHRVAYDMRSVLREKPDWLELIKH